MAPRQDPYTILADYYDSAWYEYSEYMEQLILDLERESRRRFSRVCDAACGSGLLLQNLNDGTRSLTGYDRTARMIERARMRLPAGKLAVGDLRETPPFPGPFDLVTCVYDSLNYLLDAEDLHRFFRAARGIIASAGVLVVDLNDHTMYQDRDGTVQHRLIGGVGIRERLVYDPGPPPRALTTFEFPDGTEEHRQRPWETHEVEQILDMEGWQLLDTMDVVDDDDDQPSGKVVYIAVPAEQRPRKV
ncbi:MAG: class I SAM-dependent DNA methyltransferase [Alkalispirochaeta sp.]